MGSFAGRGVNVNSIARNHYLLVGFIALVLLFTVFFLRRLWQAQGRTARRFFWLIALIVALGGVILLGYPNSTEAYSQFFATLLCLTMPLLSIALAVLTYLLLNPDFWRQKFAVAVSVPVFLVLTVLFALFTLLANVYYFFLALVGVASAVIWKALSWRWSRVVSLLVAFAVTAALVLVPETHPLVNGARVPMKEIWSGVALLLAANLLASGLAVQNPWYLRGVYLALSTIPLGGIVFHLYDTLLWDGITDGLGIAVILPVIILIGIIAAIYIGIERPDSLQVAAWFAALVVLSFFLIFIVFPSELRASAVTARRAEAINQAILRYHDRHGSYPGSLAELGIWYQTRLYEPIMFRDQTWCYQGGEGYYRLGYVYRPGFNPPPGKVRIIIQGSAGEPPNSGWVCDDYLDEALARLPD